MLVLRLGVTLPARYVAMIGSKRKVIAVVKELEKEGLPAEASSSASTRPWGWISAP
jgi:xanthine dehydrogenase accessory factor